MPLPVPPAVFGVCTRPGCRSTRRPCRRPVRHAVVQHIPDRSSTDDDPQAITGHDDDRSVVRGAHDGADTT